FFAAPLIGTIADRKGRKTVLLFSFCVCASELFLLALFPSIPMLFLVRILSGLDGTSSTIFTIVTDIASNNGDVVTQKYAYVGAMFGLAFIVGPLSGGLLSSVSFELCLLVGGLVASVGAVACALFLEETLPKQSGGVDTRAAPMLWAYDALAGSFAAIRLHLSIPRMRQLTLVLVLSTVGGGYYFNWYMIMNYQFSASAAQVGYYLSFLGVVVVFVNGFLVGAIIPKVWSEVEATQYGLVLTAVHVLLLVFCSSQWTLYALSLLFCVQSVYTPALKAIIVQESLKQAGAGQFQGNLQGILTSIGTLSTACAALLFAALFSLSVSSLHSTYLIFLVSGGLYLSAAVYFYRLKRGGLGGGDKEADSEGMVVNMGTMSNPLVYKGVSTAFEEESSHGL
ncbi:major facilitator superfamily domain-containing protein, partial [Ochromonadaceae sp. CCMP2298]